jgi:quinoprotein glucose dehydrogenase
MAASQREIARNHRPPASGRSWAASAVGMLFSLVGAILATGGLWLALLGGSLYYLLAGAALIASGVLLFRNKLAGLWLYVALFAATVAWGFWEAGPDPWALLPRIFGPLLLLLLAIGISSRLRGARHDWRISLGAALGCVLLFAGMMALTARASEPDVAALPAPRAGAPFPNVGGEWPAYGGTYAAQRYSPLARINTSNVGRLERAWVAHTRDLPENMADNKYGAETTPLKIGDTLYLCSATNILIALDARTGAEKWRTDPNVKKEWIPYTAACRGVAYFVVPGADPRTLCAARVIEGTLDGRLIAVDARTGRPCPGFGGNGQVDMKVGMGEVVPGMVSMTSPPTIVRGVIVTGHQVLDGEKLEAPSGVIQGFDAVTGELRWAWDMMRPDLTGRPPAGQTYTRGTPNMWTIASGDEALGLVYLPMGNAAVDYLSASRAPPENEYATALVALEVTTGKPRWHFRTVNKDVWDYDLGSQGSLIDLPGGVPALILPSKQGDLYVLDRRTGRPLTPVGAIRAPQGGVEPRERAATQPVSEFHTLRKPPIRERDMWGISPIDQMICRIQFRQAAYDGFYTPPTSDRRFIQYPGYNGGSDWGGIAVDPVRGLIIANYNDMPNYNRLVPREEANQKGWYPRGHPKYTEPGEDAGDPQYGAPYAIHVNAGWRLKLTGLLCKEPPYGGIRAIDIANGRTVWDRPFGTARRNGPWGIPTYLPFTIGTPNNGGGVITAGGLMFIAAATDNLIRAIDIRTGKTLWSDVLPAGGQATPISYEAGGRQYVVIMAGGHHFMETPVGDAVIAYAIPARR